MAQPRNDKDSAPSSAEHGISPAELVGLLRSNVRLIAGCGIAGFVLVMAVTLSATTTFRSSGRLYLGELAGKARPTSTNGDFDLSGDEAGDLGSELEILRSRSLVGRAILATGLNTTLAPAGFRRPRYWRFRLSRRDARQLDPAASEVHALATKLADEAHGARTFRVRFVNSREYELWEETSRLARGQLDAALKLPDLELTLARGEHGPVPGRWYELEVSPLEDVIDEVSRSLVVSAPKALVPSESGKVVTLEFVHASPRLAAALLRELMAQYVEQRQAWKSADASAAEAFVTEQLASMRRSLHDTERKLADYRSNTRGVVMDNEARAMIEQLGKFEEQRVAARLEVTALGDTKRALTNPDLPLEAYLLGEASDSVLQSLATTLSKERLELTELEGRFHQAAPDVKQKQAQVDAHLATIRNYVSSRLSRAQDSLGAINQVIAQLEEKLKTVPSAELGLAQLSRESEVYSRMYSYLLERQQQTAIVKASTVSKNRVLDEPEVPYREHAPSLWLRLAASLFGFVLGAVLVVMRRILSSTFQSDGEVRAAAQGLPVLASIPDAAALSGRSKQASPAAALLDDPGGAFAEAFRTLRTNLQMSRQSRAGNVVLVTSASQGDGKTTCVMSLAAMLAADQKRVVVVDADLRNGVLHELAGLDADAGLRGVLSGSAELDAVLRSVELPGSGFQLIGRGASGPAEGLSGERMQAFLAELRARFDFVILDSPSFPQFSDALILASLADCVLSVLRFRHTPRKRAAEHVRRIAAVAPFCGIVVNRPGGGEPYETRDEPGAGGRRKAVRVARAGSY